jgi:hypothetical protein
VVAQGICLFGSLYDKLNLVGGARGNRAEDVKHRVDADAGGEGRQLNEDETTVLFGGGGEADHRGVVDDHEGARLALLGGPKGALGGYLFDPEIGEHLRDHVVCPVQSWARDDDTVIGGKSQDRPWQHPSRPGFVFLPGGGGGGVSHPCNTISVKNGLEGVTIPT